MISEDGFAEHHNPYVERGLVGIWHTMIGESQPVTLTQSLVGYAEVTQFVVRGEITQYHHRQQCHQHPEISCETAENPLHNAPVFDSSANIAKIRELAFVFIK